MKRSMVVLALFVGACGSARTESPPKAAAPTFVELATFSGAVDPVSGVMSIQTTPSPGVKAVPSVTLVVPEPSGATLSNNPGGPTWTNTTGHCNNPAVASTGGRVRVTLGTTDYPDSGNTFLTGVYAQITSMSRTGSESCNSVPPPPGLTGDPGLGLWDFPGAIANGNREATSDWSFGSPTFSRFTFSGRILAQEFNIFSVTPAGSEPFIPSSTATQRYNTTIVFVGSNAVYANKDAGLTFVASDGAATPVNTLPANATSLSYDATSGFIWFTTSTAVGCASSNGLTVRSTPWTGAGEPRAIVADPIVHTRAWFVDSDPTTPKVGSVTCTAGPGAATLGASFTPGQPADVDRVPSFVAVGTDGGWPGFLYVTNPTVSKVFVHAADGTYDHTWSFAAGSCSKLMNIIDGPGGNLWLTSPTTGEICKLTPGSTGFMTSMGNVSAPQQTGPMAVDSLGNLWAIWGTGSATAKVVRMDGVSEAFTGYSLAPSAFSTTTYSLASGGGAIWATSVDSNAYPGSGVRRLVLPTWP